MTPNWTRGALAAGLLLSVAAISCGGRDVLHAPAGIPTFRVDLAASEATVRNKDDSKVPDDAAITVRESVAAGLKEAVEVRPDLTQAVPARFRASVTLDIPNFFFAGPWSSVEAWVELTLEADGSHFVGKGAASSLIGYGGGLRMESAKKNAIMAATQDALRNAQKARTQN